MRTIFLFCVLALFSGVMRAEDGDSGVQTRVRRVALFKNGYNWVEFSVTLPDAACVRLDGLPNALLGTIWWDTASGVRQLEGRSIESAVSAENYGYADLLVANAGKQVRISLKKDGKLEGKVLAQQEQRTTEGSFLKEQEIVNSDAPKIIFVQTESGVRSVAVEEVIGVDFDEMPQLPVKKVESNIVTAMLEKPNPGEEFRFGYVSSGMSWLPEYSLELGENGMAKLTCRANIINEMAEMKDVELQLVSGFPSLGEALVSSPVNRANKLRDLLRQLGLLTEDQVPHLARNAVSYDAYRRKASTYSEEGAGGGAAEEGVRQVEDLFYYSLPHFSCERGKSILREIFSCRVPCSHVYTCRVPNQSMLESLSSRGEPVADVWHCVRLTNIGKQAWSTGIVTCTVGGSIAARSTLYFTAPGAETMLRLNKNLQTTVQCSEALVKREERKVPGRRNDSVTVNTFQGVITLRNSSDREIELCVTKDVTGLVIEADKEGRINVSPRYSGNPCSIVEWKLTMKAGESVELNYSYEYENRASVKFAGGAGYN